MGSWKTSGRTSIPSSARSWAVLGLLAAATLNVAGTPTTETGTASWYGPGDGVATQWCTWTLRHTRGCGWLAIQSHDTGAIVLAPIVDWCQCYRDTPQERIVDLQLGVVAALGLDPSRGLYPVTTWLAETPVLTDTSMSP